MNPRVERSINRIATQARIRYADMLGSARIQTAQVAGRIQKGKKPVKTLSKLGLKLTDVSHRTTAKVVKQQSALVEHQLDALANGLRDAAKARSLRELLRGQAERIPANTAQLFADGKATLSIVAAAGGEVRDVLAGTMAELRGKSSRAKKTRKKSAATKAATARKKTARKAKPRRAAKSAAKTPASRASTATPVTKQPATPTSAVSA